jgi:hypothetical protein
MAVLSARTAESTATRPLAISLIADVMAGVGGGVAGGVYAHAERRQQAFQWAVRNFATEAPLIWPWTLRPQTDVGTDLLLGGDRRYSEVVSKPSVRRVEGSRGCQMADWRIVGKSNGASMILSSAWVCIVSASRFGTRHEQLAFGSKLDLGLDVEPLEGAVGQPASRSMPY